MQNMTVSIRAQSFSPSIQFSPTGSYGWGFSFVMVDHIFIFRGFEHFVIELLAC